MKSKPSPPAAKPPGRIEVARSAGREGARTESAPGESDLDARSRLQEAEKALRESEARLRAVTGLSSDWYWEQDSEQRFTRISEQLRAATGISTFELIGRTPWQTGILYDPEERAKLEADIAAHRSYYDFRFDREMPDGTVRHLSVSGAPMFDETGAFCGYRGIGKDVTERRRGQAVVAESQRFARVALDALADQVCVLDGRGRIVMVNSAWRAFGRAHGPEGIHDFMGADYFAACERADERARRDADAVAAGLREVLAGATDRFQYEYECETPARRAGSRSRPRASPAAATCASSLRTRTSPNRGAPPPACCRSTAFTGR